MARKSKKRMQREKVNNHISGFGLINSETSFALPTTLQRLNSGRSIQQDHVVYLDGNLRQAIGQIGRRPGLISSKWLVATDIIGHMREISPRDRISFVETATGREDDVIDEMIDRGAKTVVKTAGVYDLAVISAAEGGNRLEAALKDNSQVTNINSITSNVENPVVISNSDETVELDGKNYSGFNKYEGPKNYANDVEVNRSYFEQCDVAAEQIFSRHPDLSQILVYAPLRGSKPMTKLTLERLREISNQTPHVVYPVTSSFVKYHPAQDFFSKKGKKPASGRHGNILELRRLAPFLENFTDLVYIDEIVSGGMMTGHCHEMIGEEKRNETDDYYRGQLDEGILRSHSKEGRLGIHVYGLADAMGTRFRDENREKMRRYEAQGLMNLTELPVKSLVTEDQRYLLGAHFLDFDKGPQVVPMIKGLNYYPDKTDFDKDYINYRSVK